MTIQAIITACEQAFGATPGSIMQRTREQPTTDARMAAYLVAKMLTRQPARVIAETIGRDVSAVTHGLKRARRLVESDADFRGRITRAYADAWSKA